MLIALLMAAATANAQPYDVVRAGDSQLSCPALIAEINQLNAETAAHQGEVTAKISAATSRPGMITAHTAMGMVSGMLPFGGGLAQSAMADAEHAAMMKQVQDASASMTADMPKYNRIQHLTELSERHGC